MTSAPPRLHGYDSEEDPRPPLRVILVEDNPGERWLFAEILRSRGHVVVVCENAEAALEAFADQPAQLLLVDWILPGIDGLNFVRQLRAMPEGDLAVILVVTGNHDPEALQIVLEAGADDYIPKPTDVSLLNIRLAVTEKEVRQREARRQTQRQLEATGRELENLFRNLDRVFFSYDPGQGRALRVSPGAKTVLGYDPNRILDDPDLASTLLWPEPVQTAIQNEGPTDGPVEVNYRLSLPGDREIWIESSVKEVIEEGKVRRLDGVLADITARKRSELELERRNRELLTLFRISESTLTSADPVQAYERMLDEICEATGFDFGLLLHGRSGSGSVPVLAGHGLEDTPTEIEVSDLPQGADIEAGRLVRIPNLETSPLPVPRALEQARARSFLAVPLSGSPTSRSVLILAHPALLELDDRTVRWIRSMANTVAGFLERVDAERIVRESEAQHRKVARQLRIANQELEAFAYSMSHDLRAPLRTMTGFAHSLLREQGSALDESGRDYLRRIIASGQRSEELIRDLLNYSRISFEEIRLERVELDEILEEVLEQIEADRKETEAEIEVVPDLPAVQGQYAVLVQMITNLLTNALKFGREGEPPKIRIRAVREDEWVRIEISDNGVGIPEAQRERIFRVFERLDGQDHRPGTGIGLAIVRRGAERLGGRVSVESEVGVGSTFSIELPAG